MGQTMSFSEKKDGFSDTDQSVGSSLMTSETSVRESERSSSVSSSCAAGTDRGLDLNNKYFICSLVKEDPNRYSSRIYYRSNLGAVPFQWEAEPGKPKSRDNGEVAEKDTFKDVPLSPPPSLRSSESEKKFRCLQKHDSQKSRSSNKIHRLFVGCSPFCIKNVWPYSD